MSIDPGTTEPGVYSSLIKRLGPVCSVNPDRSAKSSTIDVNAAQYSRVKIKDPTNSGGHHPLIMVRVDANRVAFEIERELTVLDVLQFVFVEIWPAPYAGINHMRETFAPCHLVMGVLLQ